MTDTYSDERPGLMRVHIAEDRALLACARYKAYTLRAHARVHTVPLRGSLNKRDLAWYMASFGLIDADGHLRDGFPATVGGGE